MMKVSRKSLFLVLLLAGCSHSFEMLNKSEFAVEKIHDEKHRGLNVALLVEPYEITDIAATVEEKCKVMQYQYAKTPIPVEKSFLHALSKSLCEQSGYNAFVTDDSRVAERADVKIKIVEQVSGTSHGVNFLIGFPGCIVYAPAWNGYAYDVNWQFQVSIENTSSGLPLGDLILDRRMDVRYATPGHDGQPIQGNYFFGPMWLLPPLGTICAMAEAGTNSGTYHDLTTIAARRTGALAVFADGIAQEIISKINASYVRQEKPAARPRVIVTEPAQAVSKMSAAAVQPEDDGRKEDVKQKELDALRDAGVISEEEYRREVEKMKKTTK